MIILFDIDRTLIDTDKLKDWRDNRHLPALFNLPPEKLAPITRQYLASLNSSIEFSPRIYAQSLADKLGDDKQDQVLEIFLNNYADLAAVIYPEVLSVLAKLGKKHRLGIFSEGNLELQKAKLENSGLKKFFDPELIFIFPDKSDKLALIRKKIPDQTLFIVDDNIDHIARITKTDFIPVFLDRKRKNFNQKPIRSLYINDLTELEEIMKTKIDM